MIHLANYSAMTSIVQTFTVSESLRFLEGQPHFWRENGYEMHILTAESEDLIRFGLQNNIHTSPISFRRKTCSIYHDFKSAWQLLCFFKKLVPQIAHGNTPKAAILTMFAAWYMNVPIRIYEMHGLPLETAGWLGRIVWPLIERLSCRLATHVIAVSPSLRNTVIQRKLVIPAKISVIHHGSCNGIDAENEFNPSFVDKKEIKSLQQKYGLCEGQKVVGFVGRLTEDKGVMELYDAWQNIKQRFPTAKLLMIGEKDTRAPLSKKWMRKLDADKDIIQTGKVKDPAHYYALMDFLVLPSYREGLGNVVLEAAAMEKPAVVSYVTGLKDTIVKNQTGMFCQPYSVDDLTKKIAIYLENPAVVQMHGTAARTRVKLFFRPIDVWNGKLQLYRHLVSTHESVILQHELSTTFQTAH